MSNLAGKKCTPCEGGVLPLKGDQLRPWLEQIDPAWALIEGEAKIHRELHFNTFMDAISFINKLAEIAEAEGHHPDLYLFYNKLTVELWTHKIQGLFDNDFILAAKIDQLYSK